MGRMTTMASPLTDAMLVAALARLTKDPAVRGMSWEAAAARSDDAGRPGFPVPLADMVVRRDRVSVASETLLPRPRRPLTQMLLENPDGWSVVADPALEGLAGIFLCSWYDVHADAVQAAGASLRCAPRPACLVGSMREGSIVSIPWGAYEPW